MGQISADTASSHGLDAPPHELKEAPGGPYAAIIKETSVQPPTLLALKGERTEAVASGQVAIDMPSLGTSI